MSKPITVDIETVPSQDQQVIDELSAPIIAKRDEELAEVAPPSNWKDADKIAAWWDEKGNAAKAAIHFKADDDIEAAIRKTSFDGGYGQVAVVCIKVENDTPIQIFEPGFAFREPDYEAHILDATNRTLERICGHHRGQKLIGHYITFDRTFLRQRGIVKGIRMHPLLTREVKPWETDAVFDTMIAWTGDYRKTEKLDKLCKVLGIAGKGSEIGEAIDGSMVWDFVRRGEIDKVAAYCAGDVDRTWALYKRHMLQTPPAPRVNPSPAHVLGPIDPMTPANNAPIPADAELALEGSAF